jgi:tripartite-type tricarboxylate transporter receptor subunit TctC
MRRRQLLECHAIALAGGWPSVPAAAADLLRFVTSAQPGGGVDIALRPLVEAAARRLGRKALVDNRPGASGLIAARTLARAAPDGSHFGLLSQSLVTLEAMGAPVRLLHDYVPLARLVNVPCLLAVAARSAWTDLARLRDAVLGARNELAYGSGGIGSAGHLSVELLGASAGGWRLVHVPYKSLAEALAATLRGDIAFAAGPLPAALPMLAAGQVRALAVTTRQRAPGLPAVPTVDETGVAGAAGFAYDSWSGIFAPAATPAAACARVAQALREAAAAPEVLGVVRDAGMQLDGGSPARAFADEVRADLERMRPLVRQLGLKYSAAA